MLPRQDSGAAGPRMGRGREPNLRSSIRGRGWVKGGAGHRVGLHGEAMQARVVDRVKTTRSYRSVLVEVGEYGFFRH